jgi:hypothetical protein
MGTDTCLRFDMVSVPDLENGQPHTDRFFISGCFMPRCRRAISRTLTSLLLPGTFRPFREEKKEKEWKAHPGHLSKTDIYLFTL